MIPYGRQDISEEDVRAVLDVLRSDWLTQGPSVTRFEAAVAGYCNASHAVAVSNATAGLHLACLALGLGPGDVLWTSPNTFVASSNAALYCGASVSFVDIDERTYNMSTEALRDKLERSERDGTLPKIVIPVHFAGQSCDMRAIRELADRYGFRIIEDASHAIGGRYLQRPVGDCSYSDITVFSFHPVKIITTGEGGMVLTNSAALAERARSLRSHGITRDESRMVEESHGAWFYQQLELGFNYRMTDIQAALGVSQMTRLDAFVRRRHELAQRYDAELRPLAVITPHQREDAYSAYHLYPIRLRDVRDPGARRNVFDRLRRAGILVNVHYIPVHLQPYYRRLGFREGDYPQAESYYRSAISIPMYSALTEEQQSTVVKSLTDALQ